MVTVPIDERFAIQELVHLYAWYCDTRQYERLCDLFTDECVFDESSVGGSRVTTQASLRGIFRQAADKLGPLIHICGNQLINGFSAGVASGTCHVLAEGLFNIDGAQQPFRIFGYYDDHYEKLGGRWHFKSRVLKLLVPSQGAPTLGGITYDIAAGPGTSEAGREL